MVYLKRETFWTRCCEGHSSEGCLHGPARSPLTAVRVMNLTMPREYENSVRRWSHRKDIVKNPAFFCLNDSQSSFERSQFRLQKREPFSNASVEKVRGRSGVFSAAPVCKRVTVNSFWAESFFLDTLKLPTKMTIVMADWPSTMRLFTCSKELK